MKNDKFQTLMEDREKDKGLTSPFDKNKAMQKAQIVALKRFSDQRGSFTKVYSPALEEQLGFHFSIEEVYYSISDKNVLRGMHFQLPPYDHHKLVQCLQGSIHDVVVDLRKSSPEYGQAISFHLSALRSEALFIPSGYAHGFLSLEPNTLTQYLVSSAHQPIADTGILYSSINYKWPINDTKNLIISERDALFVKLSEFESPF